MWIVACLKDGENPDRTAGSSIYPAVQNMLLATRALGLGTTLTTRHTGYGKEVDAIFGLPSGGWPRGRFGPLGAGRSRMSSFKISGANLIEGFNHTEGCRLSRRSGGDRQFESAFLQQRVNKLSVPLAISGDSRKQSSRPDC